MVGEEQKEEKEGLSPWVQHSTVISIPRFDYKAPSSLIDHSHCGFLITCTIKREKSATKEAISILEKYMGSLASDGFERLKPADANVTAKRRKMCSEEIDGEGVKIAESKEVANVLGTSGEVAKETPSAKTDADVEIGSVLSLVKLTRSGLLLFTFSRNNYQHTVDILSNIFHSLGSGSLKPPLWCHRILPIQATCSLKEKDLHDAISKLVQEYLDDERNKHERPIRFAVGYNRRGIDETEMKIQKKNPKDSDELTLLDRNKCFSVVAGAVKDVAADSVVDLKSPEAVKMPFNQQTIVQCSIETKCLLFHDKWYMFSPPFSNVCHLSGGPHLWMSPLSDDRINLNWCPARWAVTTKDLISQVFNSTN
ncbi:uncharacterized protein LOC131243077 isoform X2 [Magnolia sinica]|uniref:uncharacterized protein LOC131243077 isoform X2 n=1 Tax=Magnolia sinica TaxID=86752 RepID=UPI00265865CB|nr:uncharacterized protein LOC131243077 isoform X2 [Magnolia sinica]